MGLTIFASYSDKLPIDAGGVALLSMAFLIHIFLAGYNLVCARVDFETLATRLDRQLGQEKNNKTNSVPSRMAKRI